MRFFATLPAMLVAMPVFAQDIPDEKSGADSLTIGVGVAAVPDYEGSNDHRFAIGPGAIGQINGFNFALAGNRATIDLIPDSSGPGWDIQAGPIGVLNFNRSSLKVIDDPRIRALGKRGAALELGGYVGIGRVGVITSDYDKLSVAVSYRKGVTGAHGGGIVQPTIIYFTPVSSRAAISFIASAERAERKYASAYFDVDAAGAIASGLPEYSARGGWKNYNLGMIGGYALTGDLRRGWKLAGGVTYRHLLNDFAQSPVVSIAGDRNQWLGVLGLAYTF